MCIIQTERLILREFTLNDTPFIIELLNTEDWLKFIGNKNVKTKKQAKAYLENGPLKSYVENGFGLALVENKIDNKPIGMCGIIKRNSLNHPDIGFAFLPKYYGQGYAYEIASATVAYAKTKLKLSKIYAITLPENKKSIALLKKIGLTFIKPICLSNTNEELLLYST